MREIRSAAYVRSRQALGDRGNGKASLGVSLGVAAGPGVRRGVRVEGATLFDVFPTLAATLGLPLSERLEGEVLAGAVCATDVARVADYEGASRYVPAIAPPVALGDEVEEQLESLGYLR